MKKYIKLLYHKTPNFIKLPLLKFIRLFRPTERIFQHLHFYGPFKVSLNTTKSFKLFHFGYQLENEVFWTGIRGDYEGTSMDVWIKLSEKADVIFDVGANTGIYAYSAKCSNSNAQVYAFEPIERIFDKLQKNNEINGYDVHCVKMALSSESGTATIYDDTTNHQYIASLEKDRLENNPGAEKIVINKIDFASYVEQHGIHQVDLIKIDVEYHELEVLKGMKGYLEKFRPDLLIEIVDEHIAEQINLLLEGLGYVFYNIDDDNDQIRKMDHFSRSATYNVLVCKPETAEKIGL